MTEAHSNPIEDQEESSPEDSPVLSEKSTVSFGRIKEPPNCLDEEMRSVATPHAQLLPLAFPSITPVPLPAFRKNSRQGRQNQRWKQPEGTIRQVTGCIPILQNSQILLVSASRKKDWILPKGGWEKDETMAESAIRETYEEAGVTGKLRAQPLPSVSCSSRKSDSPDTEASFFILYVQHVAKDWPESGRLRRAVPITTAMELVRPEFRSLLSFVQKEQLDQPPEE